MKKIDEDKCRVEGGLPKLYEYFTTTQAQYATEQRKMSILDAVDKGNLWRALGAKFPPYQILPDTNDVSYIKDNLVASIYSVSKAAELLATSEKDKDIVTNINLALDQEWNLANIQDAQLAAGENAALFNLGITQVGWKDDIITNGDTTQRGQVKVKNIHPLKFRRDPFAVDLQSAGYCFTFEQYHKTVLLSNPNYKEAFEQYLAKNGNTTLSLDGVFDKKTPSQTDNYFNLIIFWVKVQDAKGKIVIDEYHTLDARCLLYAKQDIKPSKFPFATVYCNNPGDSLIGVSGPARALPNSVAYNIIDSLNLTTVYRNSRPSKFVTSNSGLNLNSFAKHANDPDYTFVVNGDASKAVHYLKYPDIDQNSIPIQDRLSQSLQRVSGVDARYTGRNTGSITTTGGMQEMINRTTVIDTPKISNFEKYTKQLTELVLHNLIEFSAMRKYLIPDLKKPNTYKSIEVDFPKLDTATVFNYQINISTALPKNKARIAEMANQLMEKQMQYQQSGEQIDLITPEEWLMMQDLPMKEYMLERMGIQRLSNAVEDVSQILFEYAGLTKQGVDPNQAMLAVANTLKGRRAGAPTAEAADPLMQAGISAMPGDASMVPQGFAPGGGGMPM